MIYKASDGNGGQVQTISLRIALPLVIALSTALAVLVGNVWGRASLANDISERIHQMEVRQIGMSKDVSHVQNDVLKLQGMQANTASSLAQHLIEDAD